jgi:hypothetical protein
MMMSPWGGQAAWVAAVTVAAEALLREEGVVRQRSLAAILSLARWSRWTLLRPENL